MRQLLNQYLDKIKLAAAVGPQAPLVREAIRTQPAKRPANQEALIALGEAGEERIKQLGGTPNPNVTPEPAVPEGTVLDRLIEVSSNPNKYASFSRGTYPDGSPAYGVRYNPNASVETLAHELGHIVSDRTKRGKMVADARHNKSLAKALGIASLIAPGAISTLTPGDDDTTAAIATGILLNSPTILDEALATNNALAMMDTAGMRANLGQRGKLAGGLLSYIAAPAVSAAIASGTGNYLDDYVVG